MRPLYITISYQDSPAEGDDLRGDVYDVHFEPPVLLGTGRDTRISLRSSSCVSLLDYVRFGSLPVVDLRMAHNPPEPNVREEEGDQILRANLPTLHEFIARSAAAGAHVFALTPQTYREYFEESDHPRHSPRATRP